MLSVLGGAVVRRRPAWIDRFGGDLGATRSLGRGQSVLVENDGSFGYDGGLVPVDPDGGWGDLAVRLARYAGSAAGTLARSQGRALVFEIEQTSGNTRAGFWPSTTLDDGQACGPVFSYIDFMGGMALPIWRPTVFSGDPHMLLGIAPRAGAGWFGLAGVPWGGLGMTLAHLDLAGTDDPLYAGWSVLSGEAVLKRAWLTRRNYVQRALVDAATPGSTVYTTAADVLVDFKVTQAGSLVNGVRHEVQLRRRDADNFWAVGTLVAAGAVELYLDTVEAGVRNRVDQTANFAGAGEAKYVQAALVTVEGETTYTVVTRGTRTATEGWFPNLSGSDSTAFDSARGLKAVAGAGGSIGDLLVYPSRWPKCQRPHA